MGNFHNALLNCSFLLQIISRVESDVFIEDVAGRRTSNDSSVTEQEILEEVINNSGK